MRTLRQQFGHPGHYDIVSMLCCRDGHDRFPGCRRGTDQGGIAFSRGRHYTDEQASFVPPKTYT